MPSPSFPSPFGPVPLTESNWRDLRLIGEDELGDGPVSEELRPVWMRRGGLWQPVVLTGWRREKSGAWAAYKGVALRPVEPLTNPTTRARAGAADVLPVLPALAPLLPDGGLRVGTVVETGDLGLLLALSAGPSQADPQAWAAAVGLPHLGLGAWAGYGQDLRRAVFVDDPGDHQTEILSAVIPAFRTILTRSRRVRRFLKG